MRTFKEIWDRVSEELRGNLTLEEYQELINLEYILTQGYTQPGDDERYTELRIKKHGV
jgi:hypothetical protein